MGSAIKKRIKLLIIATTRFDLDGITNSVMNYYRYMDKSDMQIDFVVPNKLRNGLRCEIERNNGQIFELLNRNKNPIFYYFQLKKIMQNGEYDVVHAHGNSCTLTVEMFAAKRAGIKIRIPHSRNTMCKHKLLHKLLRPLFNYSYTHGFACGEEAGKWLFGNNKFIVITNGNDVEKFKYNDKVRYKYRKKLNLENYIVIGHIGRFNKQKNHTFLIRVFKQLVNKSDKYRLMLVGDGELMPQIKKQVENYDLSDKVIFIGKSQNVDQLIQAMDIMLLPSLYEGLPNVVIEWQIAGLPSIVSENVTREVKITELINFLPLEVGPKAWAENIKKIRPINRESIKNKAIAQVRKAGFDVRKNAKQLKEIYIDLIKETLCEKSKMF